MKRNSDGAPIEANVLRKSTHVGTGGDVGASFAIMEKNWICADCEAENFARRPKCFRCKASKPASAGHLEESEALLADMRGDQPWREAMDPSSQMIYYYNSQTHETQWERPAIMGPAPLATGFWGRGNAAVANKYSLLDAKYSKRPARKQVEAIEAKRSTMAEGSEFNLWYGRHTGDSWRTGLAKDEKAETRCFVETDAGYTKGDTNSGRGFFCIHFARGACALGADCRYYHRVPTPTDEATMDSMKDIFGRDRHASHRDDMSGAGSFQLNTRTLYIGGIKRQSGEDMFKIIEKHFEEWGEIENVNVIYRLSIAFVRYRLRVNAEMAREAMGHQSLDNGEILNVRWAYEDPNPVAKEAALRSNQDAVIAALQARGMLDAEAANFGTDADAIEDGTVGPAAPKRLKIADDGTYVASAVPGGAAVAYDEDEYVRASKAMDAKYAVAAGGSGPLTEDESVVLERASEKKAREDKLDSLLASIDGGVEK